MDTTAFPQPAGELVIPSPSETPSRSAASSRTDYHTADISSAYDVGSSAGDQMSATRSRRQSFQLITDIERGAPGDPSMASRTKQTAEALMLSKQKHQVLSEVFSIRDPTTTIRDRVGQDSVVTAEVKTNVIVKDEYSFLTDLSSFLSQRYGRPESSILITLIHSTCLLLAGSFDPAYLMTITALPNLVGSATNKRNAALIQAHMADDLRVPADRGVIRFAAIDESALATNGTTVLADIESKSKSTTTRNYPPMPASPRSTYTSHSTGRSFFSRKTSKQSLREQRTRDSLRPVSRDKERGVLMEYDEDRGRLSSRASGRSYSADAGAHTGLAALPGVKPTKSPRFMHSRKTSADTGEKREGSTAPTSVDEEPPPLPTSDNPPIPRDIPTTPMDLQAQKIKKASNRKSRGILGIFSRSKTALVKGPDDDTQ